MRKVLLAWELGAGLGHARRLLVAARALSQRGFTCTLAGRELWAAADEFRALGVPIFQAPHHRSLAPPGFSARGYADILASCGFQQADALWPTVLGWEAIIDCVRPDVVVGDYSPILALAALGRVPFVAIGDGFVLPPAHLAEMPRLREAGTKMASEADMLAKVASVQARRALPVPATIPALVAGQAHVVCTFRETDIYAGSRLLPATGPLEQPPAPLASAPRPAIFAYLAADYSGTAKLLQAICDTRLPFEVFVRDVSAPLKAALRQAGGVVHDRPPDLAEVLERSSLVVHHGGIGTLETCLALGRPQLLLPRHLEQTANAAASIRLKVSVALRSGFTLAEAGDLLRSASSSTQLADAAAATATHLRLRPPSSLELIVARCEEFGAA